MTTGKGIRTRSIDQTQRFQIYEWCKKSEAFIKTHSSKQVCEKASEALGLAFVLNIPQIRPILDALGFKTIRGSGGKYAAVQSKLRGDVLCTLIEVVQHLDVDLNCLNAEQRVFLRDASYKLCAAKAEKEQAELDKNL